jgi:hypothetical protein
MLLVRFKTAVQHFERGGVYLIDSHNIKKIPPKFIECIDIRTIKPYKDQQNLLLVRSGGIGDITAMSVLHDAAPKVTIVTQEKFRIFAKLWQTPPAFKHVGQPVMITKSIEHLKAMCNDWGMLYGEEAIELGSPENWYDIFLRAAGKPQGSRRPQLKPYKLPTIEGCLVVWKASSVNRTAIFEDIAQAVSHKFTNIVDAQAQGWNTKQYLDALASYEYVISVDTSALHIREGLGLPALGLYGSFHKDSRTSGYVYTTSIQSNVCTPCHARPKTICAKNNNTPYAPCLMNIGNQIQL